MLPKAVSSNRTSGVRSAGSLFCAWLLCAAACGGGDRDLAGDLPGAGASTLVPGDSGFDGAVAPFLARHCAKCHGGDFAEADLRLDGGRAGALTSAEWRRLARKLRSGEMPPPEEPRPDAAEVAEVLAWVSERVASTAGADADPGHVTMRRLNRAEYRNTIRDLLGVHGDVTARFPVDDVGHGYDNAGGVLTLPPLLLEKHLDAAEAVAAAAFPDFDPAEPPARRLQAEAARSGADHASARGEWLGLYSNGAVRATFRLPRDGAYRLRVRAFGQQAGPEPARMAFDVGGRRVALHDVTAERASPAVYETPLDLPGGECGVDVAFVNDHYEPHHADPSQRDRNLAVDWIEVVGPLGSRAATFAERRFGDPADAQLAPKARVRSVLARLAPRAFRRQVDEEDLERLLDPARLVLDDGGAAEAALRASVCAVLVSPHFLFRIEPDAPGGAVRDLTSFEIASRLSYFLWSSTPDDALLDAAARDDLVEPDAIAAQVRRMLRDPRATSLVGEFALQWLELRPLETAAPDPVAFPEFDEDLRLAMQRETEMFVEAVFREGRSVHELLDADFTFVNERLATHYGFEGVAGREFRRVRLVDPRRRGLLGHAGVLTVTSNPTRTSPVRRGKWLLSQILASPPPPPPPGLDALAEPPPGEQPPTMRERMARHRADPNCAVCHARMDPLGIGLENFDGIGRWRDSDPAAGVDARGELPDGRAFDGPQGLRRVLLEGDEFVRCLTGELMTFALGRGLTEADEPVLDALVAAYPAGGPTFEVMVQAIVRTAAFRRRR